MAFEYTKTAKDTKYNGILFRSRLEATWAAFFDLCGIKWVYEPFDLPGWSPDFLIAETIVVEVKPFSKPDFDIANKILNAAISGLNNDYTLLMLGVNPISESLMGWYPFRVYEECGFCDGCDPDQECPYEAPEKFKSRGRCEFDWQTHIGVAEFRIVSARSRIIFSVLDNNGESHELNDDDYGRPMSEEAFHYSASSVLLPGGKKQNMVTAFNEAKNQVRFTVRNKQNR